MMVYAGIGSRRTPGDVIQQMRGIGGALAAMRFVLRSGKALGADTAFEVGCRMHRGLAELFDARDATRNPAWFAHAALFHPTWAQLDAKAQQLHARNSAIMLGASLAEPVDFVCCWTPDGLVKGGTGQALRIAAAYGIPVFNLGAVTGQERAMWCMIERRYRRG
jgi:hypothetical protein